MHALFRIPALLCLFSAAALGQTTETVSPRPATPPSRLPLRSVDTSADFDGATVHRIVHRDDRRIFHYSPPAGWTIKAGDRTEFVAGNFRASIGLALVTNPPGEKAKQPDAKNDSAPANKTSKPGILPIEILSQPLERKTISSQRNSARFLRAVTRSLGHEWQIDLILEGPEEGFPAAEKQLFEALLTLAIETEADLQRAALEKEKEMLEKMAQAQIAAARPTPAGKIRGKP